MQKAKQKRRQSFRSEGALKRQRRLNPDDEPTSIKHDANTTQQASTEHKLKSTIVDNPPTSEMMKVLEQKMCDLDEAHEGQMKSVTRGLLELGLKFGAEEEVGEIVHKLVEVKHKREESKIITERMLAEHANALKERTASLEKVHEDAKSNLRKNYDAQLVAAKENLRKTYEMDVTNRRERLPKEYEAIYLDRLRIATKSMDERAKKDYETLRTWFEQTTKLLRDRLAKSQANAMRLAEDLEKERENSARMKGLDKNQRMIISYLESFMEKDPHQKAILLGRTKDCSGEWKKAANDLSIQLGLVKLNRPEEQKVQVESKVSAATQQDSNDLSIELGLVKLNPPEEQKVQVEPKVSAATQQDSNDLSIEMGFVKLNPPEEQKDQVKLQGPDKTQKVAKESVVELPEDIALPEELDDLGL